MASKLWVKMALITGLMNAGINVHDIGLALSPMAYFAQFHLDCAGVAMVTASHNSNGWTGVKMGIEAPLTFGPDEMARLKEIVLNAQSKPRAGGSYRYVEGVREAYIEDLTKDVKLSRPVRVVAACGNGTAGAFAEEVLKRIGADVIPVECDLDWNFPNYNPNPESMKMLHAMRDSCVENKAEVALGFDGDGDRCGVVDNEGEEIFADKVGVMLARDLSKQYKNAQFVVDVKSTGLFNTDPVLNANGAKTDYYKTGHSYIKRRVNDLNALVGFEKSGVNTVNGVRLTLEDGTWGLMRASSNTPNLVVVVESPTSEENMIGMFREIEHRLSHYSEIGKFDQKI